MGGLPVQPSTSYQPFPKEPIHHLPDDRFETMDNRSSWHAVLPASRHQKAAPYPHITSQQAHGLGGVQTVNPAAASMRPSYDSRLNYTNPSSSSEAGSTSFSHYTSGLSERNSTTQTLAPVPPIHRQTHRMDGPSHVGIPSPATVSSPSDSISSPPAAGATVVQSNPIEAVFGTDSPFRNDALAALCRLIKGSNFILNHQLEPTISSADGQALISMISHLPGCPPMARDRSDQSIFTLLVDCQARRCLICRSTKTSKERAVCCIRSHFRHRPFVCRGEVAGCLSCKKLAR